MEEEEGDCLHEKAAAAPPRSHLAEWVEGRSGAKRKGEGRSVGFIRPIEWPVTRFIAFVRLNV